MSQEEKRQATAKAPRTQIEDLPPPVEELSEDEASGASGGYIHIPQGIVKPPISGSAQNTCTAGNPLSGSDRDYESDPSTS